MKLFIFIGILFVHNLFGQSISVLPIAKKSINYKHKIYSYHTLLVQANEKYKCKKYLDIVLLKKNKYYAKHYIAKNRPICKKDVYLPTNQTIRFEFGNLEIEKQAEIISETDRYIKIKNLDGTIEKIYKDGQYR